jgi:hypothetical protein
LQIRVCRFAEISLDAEPQNDAEGRVEKDERSSGTSEATGDVEGNHGGDDVEER